MNIFSKSYLLVKTAFIFNIDEEEWIKINSKSMYSAQVQC